MPDPLDIRAGQPLDYSESPRFVRPISSDNIRRIFGPNVITEVEHKPNLYDGLADDGERTDELNARIGPFSIAVMLLVAFAIGVWLALGHS